MRLDIRTNSIKAILVVEVNILVRRGLGYLVLTDFEETFSLLSDGRFYINKCNAAETITKCKAQCSAEESFKTNVNSMYYSLSKCFKAFFDVLG